MDLPSIHRPRFADYSRHWVVFLVWHCMFVAALGAQQRQASIERFATEHGLYTRDILDIRQDRDGFIWVGTRNGLARFDGLKFKNYGPDRIGSRHWIFTSLELDLQGNIWFFHRDKPAQILNPRTDEIQSFDQFFGEKRPCNGDSIRCFFHQRSLDRNILFQTNDGRVYRYDSVFTEIEIPKHQDNKLIALLDLPDQKQRAYIFQDLRLLISDTLANVLKSYDISALDALQASKAGGFFLFQKTSFETSPTKGVAFYVKKAGDALQELAFSRDGKPFKMDALVRLDINPDGSGCLIGYGEFYLFDNRQNIFQAIKLPPTAPGKRPPDIHAVLRQNDEVLWVTTNEGLYKIRFFDTRFANFLPGNSLRGIAPLDEQTLLINSYNQPSLFDLSTETVAPTNLVPLAGLSFEELPDGSLLSGFEGTNIYKIDPQKRTSRPIPIDPKGGIWDVINFFHDPETGKIWAGSSHGLLFLDEGKNLVRHFEGNEQLSKVQVRYFHKNADGLWVCTGKGLFLLDKDGQTRLHLDKNSGLPGNDISFLHEDRDGIFWLAMRGGGLVRWDRKQASGAKSNSQSPISNSKFQISSAQFTVFDYRCGFFNDFIYSVLEDKYGFLWLPTNYGLIRFDKQSHLLNTYLTRDGLPEDEFNSYSHFQAPDGRIFLGGLNGLVVFNPSDFLSPGKMDAPLHITSAFVFNQEKKRLEERTALLNTTHQIELGVSDLFIELEFALLDYAQPENNRYAYYIEGLDNQWNYLGEHRVRISGLPPGFYMLRIKAQGSDGQWSSHEIRMPLVVRAPIYMRWRFWGCILLLSGLGYFLFNRWRTQQFLKKQGELEREVAARTDIISQQAEELRALDKAKSAFFANMTHELRTPLTLILTPAELLKDSLKTPADRRNLDLIRRNAEKMLDLVGQLLDIAKLESGAMLPQPMPGDAVLFSENLLQNFRLAAEQGQVKLRFSCVFSKIQVLTDFQLVERALSNLLFNALKFTPPGGTVQLLLEKSEANDKLIWKVSDTGKGIAPADLPHVFDRFFQGSNGQSENGGTGIGLSLALEIARTLGGNVGVESRVGMGSTFDLVLPLVAVPSGFFQGKAPRNGTRSATAATEDSRSAHPNGPTEAQGSATAHAASHTNAEKPLLLLVEDNTDLRTMLRAALSDKYEIREASEGSEGLALAWETVPDLVVADVMMPGMDGFAFAAQLKDDRRSSHIPLIFLTAKTAQESLMQGLELGADAYMTKPFRMEEMYLRIEKLLEKNRRLRNAWSDSVQNKADAANPAQAMFPAKESEFLNELRTLVQNNLDSSDLNGDFIGRKIGMSRMSLHRKIKSLTGMATGDFIRGVRLEQSLDMLSSGKYQVAEVAFRCGFSTPAHFSTVFKEKYGLSPSDWLKNQP